MRLLKQVQEMVTETSKIIEGDVIFIDENGYVIASTIGHHIGKYHIVGKEIIDNNLDEIYVSSENAGEVVFSGLYFPVRCNIKIAGVIGISGNLESIYKYGNIVKKMTELLLRELNEERAKKEHARMKELFLEEWILNEDSENKEVQIARGLELGIDITQAYRIMIISSINEQRSTKSCVLREKQEKFEKFCDSVFRDSIVLRNVGRRIVLFSQRTDKDMIQAAEYFQSLAKQSYSLEIAIGIDGNSEDIHIAYLQAEKAWRATRLSRNRISWYDDLGLELFVVGIPEKIKEDYIRKIFPGCSYEELDSWMEILKVYYSVDGSIQKGAEKLHMHKNTLQNKIKKMEEVTGCDVRKPNYSALLYMALVFYIEQRSSLALVESKKRNRLENE